jgi:hypothetical protein
MNEVIHLGQSGATQKPKRLPLCSPDCEAKMESQPMLGTTTRQNSGKQFKMRSLARMTFSATRPLGAATGRLAKVILTKGLVARLKNEDYVIEKVEVGVVTLHKASFVRLVQKYGSSVSVMRFPGIRVSAVWINHTQVQCVEEYKDRWTLIKHWTLNSK